VLKGEPAIPPSCPNQVVSNTQGAIAASLGQPSPEATDPTGLTVTKTWNSSTSNWDIVLNWSGGASSYGYTVSYCADPSFQSGVISLAKGTPAITITLHAGSPRLECYAVTSSATVSPAVQGMGYDPEPAPSTPTPSATGLWWGDSITLSANYLDPIPTANTTFMYDRPVRASSTTGGPPYATAATFLIPDDARSFYAFVQAHGRSSDTTTAPWVALYPRGIGPYTNIHGVSYVPQNGHIWVAADGVAQEVDVFQHTPALVSGRTWSDLTKPYISRVTLGNVILMVDGVPGVTTVYQVDLSTGLRTSYANTHDTGFTRDVWPIGIAADPDGSACYIADSEMGRIVKIPAGAGGGSTIIDHWGNYTWNFPDPTGMDVNVGHQVVATSTGGFDAYVYDRYHTYYYGDTNGVAYGLEVDRDVSTASYFAVVYTNDIAIAEAFNQNAIGSYAVANHGADIFGTSDGHIEVDPDWNYFIYHHYPQRVVINNSGQSEAYPSSYQSQDRVIQLLVTGWGGFKAKLRVVDPADVSPYAPYGGYPARHDTAVLPYEADDNFGTTDYGVATLADGSDAELSKTLTIGGDNTLTCYLKVPARYSGDNFQVEITKCNASGNPIPQHVSGLSSVYTSWKRVFVERDKMFRWGGILHPLVGSFPSNYSLPDNELALDPANQDLYCTSGTVPPCPCSSLPCASLALPIVVFDASHPYGSGLDQTRVITRLETSTLGGQTILLATLDSNLDRRGSTPSVPLYVAGISDPTTQKSAGVGLIGGCDTDANQINATGSCFYDADMRNVEQSFDDAYIEFLARLSGSGVLPYLPDSDTTRWDFAWIWFANKNAAAYIHLIGSNSNTAAWGITVRYINTPIVRAYRTSYVFEGGIEQDVKAGSGYCIEGTVASDVNQSVTNHEKGHQFHVNPTGTHGHCISQAWPATGICLMNASQCPGVDPIRYDADASSTTSPNGGDVFDVRVCVEELPND
jgi:hypothetical protein